MTDGLRNGLSRTRLERGLRGSGFSRREARHIAFNVVYGCDGTAGVAELCDLIEGCGLSEERVLVAAISCWRASMLQRVDP